MPTGRLSIPPPSSSGQVLVIATLVWLVLVAPACAGLGTWTSNGPAGQTVQTLAIDPAVTTTLYAGTDNGGVFKSADAGGTWRAVNTGLTDFFVTTLVIDPQDPTTLYAGTGSGVLFKSTDGGDTWHGLGGLPRCNPVASLAIDPQQPSRLYVALATGLFGCGVFRSTDGGETWVQTSLQNLTQLLIDPFTPTTLYGVGVSAPRFNDDEVLRSTDGGVTWAGTGVCQRFSSPGFAVVRLGIDPMTPGTLYAATNQGLCRSVNGATSWGTINEPRPLGGVRVRVFEADPVIPATVYVGAVDPDTFEGVGVFKSTDGGATWGQVNAGLTSLDVRALAIDPVNPRRLYAGTHEGVFAIDFAPPPVLTAPISTSPLVPAGLTPVTLTWTPVFGAMEYLLEYTGRNLTFANPNATAPDPVNGSGGMGGAFRATGPILTVVLDQSVLPGTYQVRVIGQTAIGEPIGTFSDASTVVVGATTVPLPPSRRPAITAPAARFPMVRRGDVATLVWTTMPGAAAYGVELAPRGFGFANPNGTAPDTENGFGGAGAGVIVTGSSVTFAVPASALGSYEVRVIALGSDLRPLGCFSDSIAVNVLSSP